MLSRINRIVIDHEKQKHVAYNNHKFIVIGTGLSEEKVISGYQHKRRAADYIIDGEKVSCYKIQTSLSRIFEADSIVCRSIEQKYVSIHNILYEYKIHISLKGKIIIFVYCVNAIGTAFLNDKLMDKIHIKSVNTYQNIILKHTIKKVKHINSAIIGRSVDYIYIVFAERGRMIDDYVIKYSENIHELIKFIEEDIEKICNNGFICEKILVLNRPDKLEKDIVNYLEAEYEACILS